METIADVLMAVSGAPSLTDKHACNIADLALDMVHAVQRIKDPDCTNQHVQIRIGKKGTRDEKILFRMI